MTSLLRSLLAPSRADPEISIEDWVAMMQSQQLTAPIQTLAGDKTAEIGGNFAGLIEGAYRANGVVFACMLVRMMLFSEARMQFRRRASGRPGELFGSAELARLEEPLIVMPQFKYILSDNDIKSVHAYVKSLAAPATPAKGSATKR